MIAVDLGDWKAARIVRNEKHRVPQMNRNRARSQLTNPGHETAQSNDF